MVYGLAAADRMLLSLVEMAEAVGVSPPTLRGWIADGCPVAERGSAGKSYQLDSDAVIAWRRDQETAAELERQEKQSRIRALQSQLDLLGGESAGVDALSSKARTDYYNAEARRMQLGRQRGELVDRTELVAALGVLFGLIGDRLQSIPDDLERAANLSPDAVERLVAAVDVMQGELAAELERWESEGVAHDARLVAS